MHKSVTSIRSEFIDYFVKQNHKHISASSLIPHNDPSMMFVNSGMVQFKNVFTGVEQRDYKRATTSQKSVRAGGKHNDLENVGYTARHHTFFEMLGNFSFGDYFKEEAIFYSWELLTKNFGLDKKKLYATIYHTDEEAATYWKKIAGLSDDRIIRIKTSDNFWSMGETGPCGPCSEIFYDHGDHIPGGLPGTPEEDGDRYIEIWNMVFMQYEQINKDTRIELPKKSIDTGMGLERISAVLQNVHDNYDIDLFQNLIKASEELTKVKSEGEAKFSHRVISDHLRSSAFLIADGVMPSNEGRGYVLRRIMRRAMRHAHQLGAKEPLLYRIFPQLVSSMGDVYPELKRAESFIAEILKSEEERFKVTLDRGLKLLDEESSNIKSGEKLSGDIAFKLYDTFGFPLDLTEDVLKKRMISVDNIRFTECMEEQKARARASWTGSGESKTEGLWFDLKQKYGATEFLGYSLTEAEASILEILIGGISAEEVSAGAECIIITNQTPFYGESGGQMGDIGIISSNSCKLKVLDTKKYLGSIIGHSCIVESGKLKKNDIIKLEFDQDYRAKLRANHSATHILHGVLREVLGGHIAQKGSLVAHDKLRFDISHPRLISSEELIIIEDKVNKIILQNSEVSTKIMEVEDAIESGAVALFGEKYDSEVRVVSMGAGQNTNSPYSTELCGGTHVKRTGEIGLFKITSESAIAAGIRRIEAITSFASLEFLRNIDFKLSKISESLKSSKSEICEKTLELVETKKKLEKELEDIKIATHNISEQEVESKAYKLDNIRVLIKILDNADPKILRIVAENTINKTPDLTLVLIAKNDQKISIVTACGNDAAEKKAANELANFISKKLGGSGGGGSIKIAQAGGVNMDLPTSLEKEIFEFLGA